VFSKELRELIFSVLTSWQVIVITLGIVIYIAIVNSVAQLYHSARPNEPKDSKPKKNKKAEEPAEEAAGTDELGLEE
jgi:hypothetical protein